MLLLSMKLSEAGPPCSAVTGLHTIMVTDVTAETGSLTVMCLQQTANRHTRRDLQTLLECLQQTANRHTERLADTFRVSTADGQ